MRDDTTLTEDWRELDEMPWGSVHYRPARLLVEILHVLYGKGEILANFPRGGVVASSGKSKAQRKTSSQRIAHRIRTKPECSRNTRRALFGMQPYCYYSLCLYPTTIFPNTNATVRNAMMA